MAPQSTPMALPAVTRIRARQIGEPDAAAVADLLTRGFPERSRTFWQQVLARLTERPAPADLPRYGYLLESDGRTVGAILLIFSRLRCAGATTTRCNVSSWFVEPAFRGYASLLVSKAFSHREATYLNVTPAPHTVPILLAQGYSPVNKGIFVAVPALQSRGDAAVRVASANSGLPPGAEPFEHDLLLEHARYGCLSLWCTTAGGALPFVLRPRRLKRIVPCAQLIYARSVGDLVRCAGPLGRFLALRGRPLVIIDADGPIPGLAGKYLDARQPKYFKGPDRPRLGDLVYSETAMFGI
jgi:hypothetical protein